MVMSASERISFLMKDIEWHRRFAWLPHRCIISKKWMWLKWCYAGNYYTRFCEYGIFVRYRYWTDSKELTIYRLKN